MSLCAVATLFFEASVSLKPKARRPDQTSIAAFQSAPCRQVLGEIVLNRCRKCSLTIGDFSLACCGNSLPKLYRIK